MSVNNGTIRSVGINGVKQLEHDHSRQRVLVGSDCGSAEPLRQDLQRHGFDATVVSLARTVLSSYNDYELVLLDTDLPDLDGVSVCRFIRQESELPIIGFTSSEAEVDRVLLLEAGCDDCVDIPYRSRELVARIRAVLRRSGTGRGEGVGDRDRCGRLELGPLVIDVPRREVLLHDSRLVLTRKEFDLLCLLATEPDRIFRRQELMADIWNYPDDCKLSVQESRTIDTHVSSLRSKLGSSEWITTIRGVGFRFGTRAPSCWAPSSGSPGPVIRRRSANVSDSPGSWRRRRPSEV